MTGEIVVVVLCVAALLYIFRKKLGKVDAEIVFRLLEILFRVIILVASRGKAGGGFSGGGGRSGGGGSGGRW